VRAEFDLVARIHCSSKVESVTRRAAQKRRAADPTLTPGERDWRRLAETLLIGAVIAVVFLTPLIPSESAASLGSHAIPIMATMLLLAVWSGLTLARPDHRVVGGPVLLMVVGFLVLVTASAWWMASQGHPRPTLNGFWIWVFLATLFFLLRQILNTGAVVRSVLSSMIALTIGLAALGFYQYGYSLPQMRAEFAADPDTTLRTWGIDPSVESPERRHFIDRLESKEPIGTFALANSLAGVLAVGLTLLLGNAGTLWRHSPTWGRRCVLVLSAAALFGCLLLTKSRAALLAVLLGVGMLGWMVPEFRRWLNWRWTLSAVVLLVAAVVTAIATGGLDRQVLTEAPKSLEFRFQYWRSSCMMIAAHPWTGCGPGNFKEYYTQYKLPVASETISDPHNFLLEVAATTGLPAVVMFVGIVVAAAICLVLTGRAGQQLESSSRLNQGAISDEPLGKVADRGQASRPRHSRGDAAAIRAVYGGILMAFPLAMPVGWSIGLMPDPAVLFISLPIVGLVLWALHPWVEAGSTPIAGIVAAEAVLLVNLLAAGGISYPGVGLWCWVLLVLMLNGMPGQDSQFASQIGNEGNAEKEGRKAEPSDSKRPSKRTAPALAGGHWRLIVEA
jgi:hypothetical protein